MKRHLLPLTALAVLWIRQVRYERRISNRQGRWERDEVRSLRYILDQWSKELEDFGEQNGRWAERLVKQINKALRPDPRRASPAIHPDEMPTSGGARR